MRASEETYQITADFLCMPEAARISIMNGSLETIYDQTAGRVSLLLPKGLYTLKAVYIDYCQEHLMVVEGDAHFQFEFRYPSVAPALGFTTTHEYFSGPAESFSRMGTNPAAVPGTPDFFFFASKYDKDLYPESNPGKNLGHFSLRTTEKPEAEAFSPGNSQLSDDFGWFCHSSALPQGLHFLEYNDGESIRMFPFYVYPGYQTQFFLRYNSGPDFENAFFYYSATPFSMQDRRYVVLDKVMLAYKAFSNYEYLTEADKQVIAEEPYLMSLITVLHLLLGRDNDPDLRGTEMSELADLRLLRDEGLLTDLLPTLSAVMSKIVTKDGGRRIAPGSLADRVIDHLKFDLFWNSFSHIDDPGDWKASYDSLVGRSKAFAVKEADNLILKTSKKLANLIVKASPDTKFRRLENLLGKAGLGEEFTTTLQTIGNVSQISERLRVPPTTVLRNYKTYNDIFKKLK